MTKKWEPSWKEEKSTDGEAILFKEPAINPLAGLPNPIVNISRTYLLPLPSFLKKYKDYDIIHFVGEADLTFPVFSFFVKKPKVLQCVGIFRKGGICKYYTQQRAFLGKTFKQIFPNIADYFLISDTEEKDLIQHLGVPKKKITILPLGVDTEIYHPDFSKKKENTILFVGRIDPVKGLHTLLDALQHIKIPTKVIIIGPPFDPEYTKKVEEKSREINKAGFHNVTLMGEMSSNDLVPWYQQASILVCPYIYEAHSNVVREALACGTPVVSTGTHLIENQPDGILLARNDPENLASAISNFLTDKEMLVRFAQEGRVAIEQFFSWDVIIDSLVKFYKGLLCFSEK